MAHLHRPFKGNASWHDDISWIIDVTLVTEDKKQCKAYKVVLSASSTVFKNIIGDNFSSNPIIY